MHKAVVVIPNWNGEAEIRAALDSLMLQTLQPMIIVVDNGSVDSSIEIIERHYPTVELIKHRVNKGYAGGVNPGLRRAIELQADYVAPFNNDAVADRQWLENLVQTLDADPGLGIAACKVASSDGAHLDSTGDYYTTWGLPYPRGRGEADTGQYDGQTDIFGASGAASLYRVRMLEEVGLLDEDFFAYYEDVDLSFRAQLAGWKIRYVPASVVYHETSTTASKIKGFFTLQTQKNLPMLLVKNVPASLMPVILPRFLLVYASFFFSALLRGQLLYALQGAGRALRYTPKKLAQRRGIQRSKKVGDAYIASMLVWDLPPNAAKLRWIRNIWRRIRGRGPA